MEVKARPETEKATDYDGAAERGYASWKRAKAETGLEQSKDGDKMILPIKCGANSVLNVIFVPQPRYRLSMSGYGWEPTYACYPQAHEKCRYGPRSSFFFRLCK